jgi:hypothetical protein
LFACFCKRKRGKLPSKLPFSTAFKILIMPSINIILHDTARKLSASRTEEYSSKIKGEIAIADHKAMILNQQTTLSPQDIKREKLAANEFVRLLLSSNSTKPKPTEQDFKNAAARIDNPNAKFKIDRAIIIDSHKIFDAGALVNPLQLAFALDKPQMAYFL